jgi:hypothetical protein
MSVCKRRLGPLLFALFVSGLATQSGCGNLGCLRNSDCGSHMECRKGECIDPKAPSQAADAGAPNGEAGAGGDGATSR